MSKVLKISNKSELLMGLILLILSFGLPLCVFGYVNNGNNQNEQHHHHHQQQHQQQHQQHQQQHEEEHLFRHRQHHNTNNNNNNNHRIEQSSVNDLRNHHNLRLNNTTARITNNVYLRHHNHHQLPNQHQHPNRIFNVHSTTTSTQSPFTRHHLRHYNRHHQTWEQRVFPSLRHQQITTSTTSTTTTTPPPWVILNHHSSLNRNHFNNFTNNLQRIRYFDRDSLYVQNEFTTQGPTKLNESHGNFRKFMSERYNQRQRKNDLVSSKTGRIDDSLEFLSDEDEDDDDDVDDDDEDAMMLGDEGTKQQTPKSLKSKHIVGGTENIDDYYEDDDNSIEGKKDSENNTDEDDDDDSDGDGDDDDDDADYSNEEEEKNSYDVTTNRIDDRNLLRKRIDNSDTEDIYSRSYIPGTLTRYKYEMFGTHEAVERSRMSHITNQKQHRALANAHATKVYMEAACKHPKPRIEKIQKDPSKVYVPHCTILHRCADDTGCCATESHTCVAKRTQNVDLYFFVKTFGSKQGTVEKHTFVNHTECHCVDKAQHLKYPPAPAMLRQATILDCTCPKLFEKVLQEDGYCRCDCSSGNSGCDWLKRGMEHFSVVDRKCINEGRCKPPTCEFGTYIKKHGRCPRKDDKSTSGFL